MKKTRLTRSLIDEIVSLRKLRMDWGWIAKSIGVSSRTLERWRKKGKESKSGIHRELVDALDEADAETIKVYASVVSNEASKGKTTKIKRTVEVRDGKTFIEEERIEPPNSALALKILERADPANWAEIKRLEIDWRKEVRDKGVDPEEIEKRLLEHFAQEDSDADPDPDE